MEKQIIFASCIVNACKVRLDEYLSSCLKITRSFALNLIKDDLVLVNKEIITVWK